MRFLGEHQDMPFFMVHAGKYLFRAEKSDRGSRTLRRLPAVPLSRTEESFESEDSDNSLSTLATFTTANDGDSAVEESIERGEKQGKNMSSTLTPAKRSSSGRNIRVSTFPPALSMGHASSSLTKPDNKTPSTRHSPFASSILPRQRTGSIAPVPLALTQSALVPRALTLTVHLSKESFAPSCGTRTKHVPQDVKIDVFFNGEMTASTYVPARYRGETSNVIQLTQRFSGRRVDRMAERPWVIVPPGQNADGSLRTSKRNKGAYIGAQERWDGVGKALEEEGGKFGRNQYGDQSLVGEYLTSLSRLEMPAEVDHMQKGGGPNFGVIDVLVTLGKGQKDEPEKGYLKEPARLRLRGFHVDRSDNLEVKSMQKIVTEPVKAYVESDSLNMSAAARTRFTTPLAPSAAPCAVRRRQSIPKAGPSAVPILPTEPGRTSDLAGICDTSMSAMQVNSPTMSDALIARPDGLSVQAGTPVPKSVGQPRLDLPSRPAKTPSSSASIPAGSRARVAVTSRSTKPTAALDPEARATGEIQLKKLRPRLSNTRDPSQSGYISDSSIMSSTQSSPSTISRPRNLRGANYKHTEDASAFSRSPRHSGLKRPSDGLESSRDLITVTNRPDSTSTQSNRRTRPETSTNHIPSSTPKLPQKRYKHSSSTLAENVKPQRRQYPSRWGVTDKPTLAEEMAQIEASSRKEMIARATTVDNEASTTPSDGKQTSPRQIVRFKVQEPVGPQKTHAAGATNAEVSTPHTNTNTTPRRPPGPSSNKAPQSTASLKRTSDAAPSPTPQVPRRRRSAANTSLAPNLLPVFPTPALSQDCVISYAEETDWKTSLGHVDGGTGGDGGVYRQIKAERNGWFEERGVLMGVRFLVG